ncbi:NUDIX hydrolase [Gracilibacillus caseinilyticus]|uniref:NUDIX hydrolase n=1 Tax=Gracilibacillus caseinilyticus TaxID=2932256 RepID=A0ABY4F2J2_9BACI|nr:NUDIX hydrolase [Gracilibacillus caseinilyticus]UOQ50397.1 NUDIX hydrolase [Gracilibacillus caseinilyticus]
MNITKNNGFEFLDFLVVKESELYDYHRLAGSYAVIECDGNYLFCYNTLRKQWELSAGRREKNETPKDCAIRELYEETGQCVSELEFKGLLKIKNLISGEMKYNPVYFSTIEKLQAFQKNNEISEIQLWDLKQKIGYIDEVDIKILDYFD